MEEGQNSTSPETMIQAAKKLLQLQKDLVQYIQDAVNGRELSETAKAKYYPILQDEKTKIPVFEDLVRVLVEAANSNK